MSTPPVNPSGSQPAPGDQDRFTSVPTPKTPTTPANLKRYLVPAGIAAVTLILAALIVWFGITLGQKPGSTQNDETASPKKIESDFVTWSAALRRIQTAGELPASKTITPDSDEKKVSSWDKWFTLPSENAVRAALLRRLPQDVKITSLAPLSYEKSDGDFSVTYLVTVRLKAALYLVPISTLHFDDPALAKYQFLTQYVLASTDLPPGQTYDDGAAKRISEGHKNLTFSWRVNRAAVEDGKWRVFDADPIYLQQSPQWEQRLVRASGGHALVLRTETEIGAMQPTRDAALQAFATRLKSIDDQVAKYRADRLANVPGPASRSTAKFGGSGSGEPTRSAARIGGGAAGGAAIGALATGGDGAATGIGAGAGFVTGLIYDTVSKSNDKKKFEEAKERDYQERAAARNSALRAANGDITAFQQKLIDDYARELSAAAQQRNEELKTRL